MPPGPTARRGDVRGHVVGGPAAVRIRDPVTVVDHDLRALPGQRQAERAAEPPSAAGHHRHPLGQRRVIHDPSQPDWPERAGFIVHQYPHRSSEAKPVDGRRRSVDCSAATAALARAAAGKLRKQATRASLSSVAVQ